MKLLFDQNISFRVVTKLRLAFPDCQQVRELKLENASERDIWEFAKRGHYAVVTFDADFYDLVTLFGHPPKVIWLRMGNTSSENLIRIIENYSGLINSFLTDENYSAIGCLEIARMNWNIRVYL